MPNENWKDIPGYEGRYQVSDLGRVCAKARTTEKRTRWGGVCLVRLQAKLLTPYVNTSRGGYRYVNLYTSEGQHMRRVAGLCALTFLGLRPEGMQVLHGDGDAANDALSNLRYGTPLENMADMLLHGTRQRGVKHPQARLTERDVADIKSSDKSRYALAEHYGVHHGHIYNIRAGFRRAHG